MTVFGKRLKAAREKKGLKQSDVADVLGIKTNSISRWERGDSTPSAPSFLQLCELYKIENPVAFFLYGRETSLELNDEGLQIVRTLTGALEASGLYRLKERETRILPLYLMPASAGTGQFLDGSECEDFEADNSVPLSADFCIRIAGDSMEPRIQNGQIVFVKKQSTLEHDEIGIFSLNGDALCKKLYKSADSVELISLNTKYDPITIHAGDELRVFGKVV